MTKAQRTAFRFRRWILVLGLMFEFSAVTWALAPYWTWLFRIDLNFAGLLATPLGVPDPDDENAYLLQTIVVLGLLLLGQWFFLRPSRLLPVRLTARGRPLLGAILVAAAMAMLLTLGAVTLTLEILDLWVPFQRWRVMGLWGCMLGVWALWAYLFQRYWRDGDHYTQLGRMVRALVAGSVLEAIVAAPVQACASGRGNCYCEKGSYTTLVCAGAVLFWAFGPGIILLFLRENYRRTRLFPHCESCGYDLRGSQGACPECGRPARETLESGSGVQNYGQSAI